MKPTPLGIWNYSKALPRVPSKHIVSLSEGHTPLLPSVKQKNVFFKLEYENPTGSFKDRGSTVEVSHAKAHGFKHVVCASTGNMGASIAAYAARAGIQATICVPNRVPEIKRKQILSYGAKLVSVNGGFNDALHKTWEIAQKQKHTMLTGDYPLRMEGQKTLAYELLEDMGMQPISQIIVPIGNGTLMAALFAGFRELLAQKKIKKIPTLIGVQAANCAPVYSAWKNNVLRVPVSKGKTMAGAIECGAPIYGQEALMSVTGTNGKIIAITESQLKASKRLLAENEGLYAEYSGAAAYAALNSQKWKGNTVVLLCGHGLKE